MRLTTTFLAAAMLALLTAGCSSDDYVHTYYSPAAPGARIIEHPRAQELHFQRKGVIVGTLLGGGGGNPRQAWVSITFEVPEGKVVTLLDKTVEVSATDYAAQTGKISGRRVTGYSFWGDPQYTDLSPDAPMTGKTAKVNQLGYGRQSWSCKSDYAIFCFSAWVPAPESGPFSLKMPRFSVNGAEIELPLITVNQNRYFEAPDALTTAIGLGLSN